MIEFRTLAYFAAACRSGSFGEAARVLGIAPSTLSASLKSLEQETGQKLFRRGDAGFYPTEPARLLLRAADSLLMAERCACCWANAPDSARPRQLVLDIQLSFTIGGMSQAVPIATNLLGTTFPEISIDATWDDDRDQARAGSVVDGADASARIVIGLDFAPRKDTRRTTMLLADDWVFACRLPASTRELLYAADLESGRIVVPMLARPLIEQADRYFSKHGIAGVRFLQDHPGDLPRIFQDYPDATLFLPRSLVSRRLGLNSIATVVPRERLASSIVAHHSRPDAPTAAFLHNLKQALAEPHMHPAGPTLSRRQVRYFNAIYRCRRVSAASKSLGISQPALSEQLQKLETTIKSQLFDRHGDGVVPTSAGERFIRVSKVIEAGFERLTDGADGTAGAAAKRITIGVLPSVHQHGYLVNQVTDALVDIQKRRPSLRLTVHEAPNAILQDWVLRGLVGTAIVETALPHMPRLPLGSSEALAAIVRTRHQLLPAGPVAFADLVTKALVLPTHRFGLRHLLETAADTRGLKIRPFIEADALPMIVAILDRLPICTVLPPSAVEREIAEGELSVHPIVEPVIARRLFAIYSGERALSEFERDLVNTLRRILAKPRESDVIC